MNIEFILAAVSIGTLILSGGIAWGMSTANSKATDEKISELKRVAEEKATELKEEAADSEKRCTEIIDKIWEQIGKCRTWQSGHERDSSETRLAIEKSFGGIREILATKDGKFETILSRLDAIDEKLKQIESKN